MKGRICIAIACAGLLAMPAEAARAQATFRETGSVTVGSYVVWVRGTNASAVELFVGRGFRDAFAPAHEIDAVKLQHWIDSVRALAPMPADDSSAVAASAKGALVGGDVSMVRRMGGSYSGLRLFVGGEEPIQMAEPTARDFIAALDSAAHVARELSAPVAQTVASVSAAVTPAVSTPIAPAPVAVAPPPAPPVPVVPVAPAPIAAASVAAELPATPLAPSTSEAPPELVLPVPAAPVLLLASRVDIMPLPMPPIPPARVPAPLAVAAATVDPTPAPAPVVAAPPPDAPAPVVVAPTPPAPVPAPVIVAPPPPAADTSVPPHPEPPADKLIHTPLGPFTIPAALLSDRDKEAQYCYTQLGLKYTPDLKGEITVKLSLDTGGAVEDAVVTKRSWQGISAGEVESCVRALAHDWTFASSDPTITDGAKLLTFSFAP